MDFLLAGWARISAQNADLPLTTIWWTILGAAATTALPFTWSVTRHVVTIAHEGGHGLVATWSGRRLTGIRLHSDTSGLTVSRGRPTGPGMVFTLLAGYTAPALLGLGSAALLGLGYGAGMLWALLAALTVLLVQIRNWFGLWSVAVTGGVIFVVTWFGSDSVQSIFALFLAAFLILGAIRAALELQVTRSRRRASGSDADQLARLTHLPGIVWVGVFVAVNLACAAVAAQLLGLWCVSVCA
ncbi:MAG: M50 family metallopeptidase [Cryobacterium sp.]